MKKLIIVVFIFLYVPVFGAVPTMEGLFRNGKNKGLGGKMIIMKMMVDEMSLEEESEKKISYLKFYFSVEDEKRIKMLQVHFPDGEMRKNSATHLYFANNLLWNLKKDTEDEKILFYSIISMLGLNDSRPISYYLGKQSGDYKTNNRVMDSQKVKLLKKYKDYLTIKKEDKETEEISPLIPEDEEQKEKVETILKAPMYTKNGNVNLIRKEKQFFWELKLPTIHALFNNDNHFIRELKIQTLKGPMNAYFSDFTPFNGLHKLPKEILIKDRNKISYRVKFLSYTVLSDPKKSIHERHNDFKEVVEKYDATLAGDVEIQKIESSFPNTFLYL